MNKSKEQTKREIKYLILIILFTTFIVCSIYLLPDSTSCEIDCSDNDYKETFGINNGWYGIIIFSILWSLSYYLFLCPEDCKSYKRLKSIVYSGIILGSIIAIYFLYLQQFVLKEYCIYCLIIDIGLLVCLGIIIFIKDKVVVKIND